MRSALLLALTVGFLSCASPGSGGADQGATLTSRTIRSGTANLRCDILGTGPDLIFLHAGVADRRSWHEVMKELATRYRSVAYDRRGFGETTCEAESHSHVDDLQAVIEGLGLGRVVLIGNSQGGRVAIDFALAHPERVRALVLVAAAVSGDPGPATVPDSEARLEAAIEAAEAAGDIDLVNSLEAHLWLDGPRSPEGRVSGSPRALFLDMNGRALKSPSTGDRRPPPSAFDRLEELAMPVQVFVGELDLEYLAASGSALADRVQRGTLTILPGAAHLPQVEQPQAFTRALEQFLQRVNDERP